MASNEKIRNIFKDIRKKVQTHTYVPASVTKKNTVEGSEGEKTTITKKK